MARELRGISYPFRIEGAGAPASAVGVDAIKAALIGLLKTPRRSRVMRPELGNNLYSLVFENVGPLLHPLIEREILTTINNELPMVSVSQVDITDQERGVTVNVQYSVQGQEDETGDIMIPVGG